MMQRIAMTFQGHINICGRDGARIWESSYLVIDISKTLKTAYEGGLVRALGKEHAIARTCSLCNRKC